MPRFGAASRMNRMELADSLRRLLDEAIKGPNFSIIDAARTLAEQIKNVESGASQTLKSKHLPRTKGRNKGRSAAADIMPYPAPDWDTLERGLSALKRADAQMEVARFYALKGYIRGVAACLGIAIRTGEDWDADWQFGDHSFIDLPHVELVDPDEG